MEKYKHRECLPSKPFMFPQTPTVLWQLDFYPNGRGDSNCTGIYLSQMESMVGPTTLTPSRTPPNSTLFSPTATWKPTSTSTWPGKTGRRQCSCTDPGTHSAASTMWVMD